MWFEVKKKKNLRKYVNDWAFFSTFSQWQKKNKDNIIFPQSIWRNSQYKYNVHLQNIIFMYYINTDFSILTGLKNKINL